MRYASLLPPLLLALTVAACARQQSAYYVTDARTGQRVTTGQQRAPHDGRGLVGAGGGPQANGYNGYASTAPQRQGNSNRGLFNSDAFDTSWFSRQSRTPTYAQQPQPRRTYAPQTYSYQPPPQQQAQAQPSTTMQYRPPQNVQRTQTAYASQPYRPPQPQPTGYYSQRYGWY